MKTILIITLLFLTSNLFAQKTIYTDNSGNGVIEYTLIDKDGKIQEKGFYFNNKRTGTWTRYSSSGQKCEVAKFKDGKRHGTWSFYDETGKKIFEVVYRDNKKISASEHRYSSN
jgi:antitoxin component YwqK of YwqJK toxin-antitoxin module